VSEYDGEPEIQVNQHSGIEELSDGVGNVPAADPGSNEQLDEAAADGGQTTDQGADDDYADVRPVVVQTVRDLEADNPDGVAHARLLGELVADGHDPETVEHGIEKTLQDGQIHEPTADTYRST